MHSIAPFRFYRGLAINPGQRRSHRNLNAIVIAICLVTAAGYAMTCTGTHSAQQKLESVGNKASEMAEYVANAVSTSSQRYGGGTAKRNAGVLRSFNMSGCKIGPSVGVDYQPCIMRQNLRLVKMAGRSGAPHMSTVQLRRVK
jgi:hypothetical protein